MILIEALVAEKSGNKAEEKEKYFEAISFYIEAYIQSPKDTSHSKELEMRIITCRHREFEATKLYLDLDGKPD